VKSVCLGEESGAANSGEKGKQKAGGKGLKGWEREERLNRSKSVGNRKSVLLFGRVVLTIEWGGRDDRKMMMEEQAHCGKMWRSCLFRLWLNHHRVLVLSRSRRITRALALFWAI
jgi:hypothetical protein